jgi:hypothetical protein
MYCHGKPHGEVVVGGLQWTDRMRAQGGSGTVGLLIEGSPSSPFVLAPQLDADDDLGFGSLSARLSFEM